MPCVLRPPTVEELPTLSAFCLRSKAVWGYDEDFIEACRSELTIERCDLRSSSIAVAEENGWIRWRRPNQGNRKRGRLVKAVRRANDASRRFRDEAISLGYQRRKSDGCLDRMVIEADPDAAPVLPTNGSKRLRPCPVRLDTRQNASQAGQSVMIDVKNMSPPGTFRTWSDVRL